MVAGGNFSQVENHGSSAKLTRNNIFSFDAATGKVDSNFAPNIDGLVHVVVISPDGKSVLVGGEFHHVNGASRVGLTEVSLSTGAIVSSFKVPSLDGRVYTMKLAGGRLYIGGSFTHVAGKPIAYLAALDPTTGAVDPSFSASFSGSNNPVNPGSPLVQKMDISPDGRQLVVIGNFMKVNGLDRPQIAMFDIAGGTPTLAGWETDRYRAACGQGYQTYLHDVEFSPDGAYFVVGTTGGAFSGGNQKIGCDSVSRWETTATGAGLDPTWIDFTGNDTIWSVAVTGTAVYTGGHNRWMNNAYGSDFAGPGAVDRPGLSTLDPTTGVPFTWNPTRTTGVGVFDLLATSSGLWIGDDTDWVGHEYHYKLAYFPLTGGTVVPDVTPGSLPSDAFQLGSGTSGGGSPGTCGQTTHTASSDVVTRRHLDPSTSPIATAGTRLSSSGTAWGDVRGAFMLSGTLYTGWRNGDLCAGGFNGSTFGALHPVDQHGNKFMGELSTVTGMFFANDRIYYTKRGKDSLYYRAFVSESDLVGAVSSTASSNVSGLDFSKVGGMLLSGNRLYYVTRADGILHRADWDGTAPVGGTSVKVSGPSIDGVNWTSAGLFMYAGDGAPPTKQPPVANLTVNCTQLSCAFAGSGSFDPDGTIAAYAWSFGDGSSSTQPSPSHTYAAAGTYTAKLTITDNDGLVGSMSRAVTVSATAAPLNFLGESHANANADQWSVRVPTNVVAGDALVLAVATAATAPSNPSGSGWTLLDTRTAASLTSKVWKKVATASDAGATVTISAPSTVKTVLDLLAYRGTAANPVAAVVDRSETVSRTTHTTPTVTVPTAGSWVLSIWAEKSSSTTTLSPPAGLVARYASCGTGPGRTCLLVGDGGTAVGAGSTAGGLTATADTAGSADTMWTLVVAPG